MALLISPRKLRSLGILGMNGRNGGFIEVYNRRSLYPLVNDKLKTKKIAEAAGIAVPELIGVVEIQQQVSRLPQLLGDIEDFVVKPAQGAGGDGIIVIKGKTPKGYRRVSGRIIEMDELSFHVSKILSGMFSLGGRPDKAIIERRVEPSDLFARLTYQGVPDLRVVVFLGVPVMAMVRLPTRESDGKANLHRGGVGAGIDLVSGVTGTAVQGDNVIEDHPDTGNRISGLQVPDWDKLLELSSRGYDITGLGYIGVDIVLDRDLGPLILELNARPGLSIQIANRSGLRGRLRLVEQHKDKLKTTADRLAFAREHFADGQDFG